MKIIQSYVTLEEFETWSGATYTKDKILEADKGKEFDDMIEELYPEGIGETELNDLLWFDDEWIFEMLGISEEDEDEEDDYE